MAKGRGPIKAGSVRSKTKKPKRKAAAASKKKAKPSTKPRKAKPAPKRRAVPKATDTLPEGTEPRPVTRGSGSSGRAGGPDTLSMPKTVARVTQLDWNDSARRDRVSVDGGVDGGDDLVDRWVRRGDDLLRQLNEHGAGQHEYRADLREGRFVWIDPQGRVSAEARAQVVCSWSRSTTALAMAWADPLVRASAISRIDGMPAERDDIDEERAWRVAMEAVEIAGADYLYRVPTPHAWYFLALRELTFAPERDSFTPGTPVGLVLRGLADTRQAIESRAEPAAVVRERLAGVGSALMHHAEYAYRNTDWVARLERTGRRMGHLAGMVPRASYGTIAAGRGTDDWVERDLAVELIHALTLLEDEWNAFA